MLDSRVIVPSPETVALFRALNECVGVSSLPHPIEARNARLLTVWRHFVRRHQDEKSAAFIDDMLTTTQCRFEQNIEVLCDCIQQDPAWRARAIDRDRVVVPRGPAMVLPTASLMYWSREHRLLIESTAALEEWLVHSDVGDDLPCDLVRAPAGACYIRFGKMFREHVTVLPTEATRDAVVQGVYVFDSPRDENRALTLIPVFEMRDLGLYGASVIELIINDERRSINDEIAAICSNSALEGHFRSVTEIVTKVVLYLEQAQNVQRRVRDYSDAQQQLQRLGAKKTAKLARKIPQLYDKIILGPSQVMVHAHGGEVSPHLRRGHFRLQPYGPQFSMRKVIFVAPTWVRADRMAENA
ncbi:hypothetical protein WJ41_13905 [Burkholderia ubonensis]|uniref:hypothetical protein n=1 Tax=Burkholderia ubonensis TaxID=101571 RepID=UPI0007562E4A|nr:hypothetical protein [Burkholderia ubonensis]KVH72221.1 hypothetical protein WJ41_13905 [Burkholderia ubonensis]KVU04739.1 hypothetical protein WK61_02465 [Burkholderia ubonensis]